MSQIINTTENGIVRDMNSKALLNTNRSALERNRTQRAAFHRQQIEFQELRSAYSTLERRLEDLTSIVKQANSFIRA